MPRVEMSENDMYFLIRGANYYILFWSGVSIVLILPLARAETAETGRHYTPSSSSECSALNLVVRTEIEKDSLHDVLQLQAKTGNANKNMCNNGALLNCLMHCISCPWIIKRRSARNMLLELLDYGTLLSGNGGDRVLKWLRGKTRELLQREAYWQRKYENMNWTWYGGHVLTYGVV